MKKRTNKIAVIIVLAIVGLHFSVPRSDEQKFTNWTIYGGQDNIKYSSLKEVDTSNVTKLKVAWTYHSENNDSLKFSSTMESNPIIIDGILYALSPQLNLFAIDAATGKEKWKFNPSDSLQNKTWPIKGGHVCRGVAYWSDEGSDKRIIYAVNQVLLAINAVTGKIIPSFGKEGGLDLRIGLDRDPDKIGVALTSPVAIYKNIIITGSGQGTDDTPGHIRGFDAKTGKQKWIFHTIPYPNEKGYNTWNDKEAYKRKGSANPWSGFSLDEKRGIVFAGTGNPTSDFYGGDRLGNGLFGNCILAIDAITGKLKWHFQTVHHDVWDMDISSPPALITINKEGKNIDAVVQTTKTGMLFILDRATGKPIFPVIEKPVPKGAVIGEKLSLTQPFPVLPKPFVRQKLTEKDLNTLVNASSYQDIQQRFRSYRSEGIYTPPSEQGTIILPGYDGGGEWGGPAVDPQSNILYVNANEMAWILKLTKIKPEIITKSMSNYEAGKILYSRTCMACHGTDRKGGGEASNGIPGLVNANKKYNYNKFIQFISTGKGRMPSFNYLKPVEKKAIATYILNLKEEGNNTYTDSALAKEKTLTKYSYSNNGYKKFLTKEGYPAISPPWGTISAINLNTGQYEWKIPFGEFEELKKKGVPATGRENYGGPVVTAGGLLFIGASADGKFRAINKRTGKILWQYDLPAPGAATPAVYAINGKQYIVIGCGGSKWEKKKSDAYVAFALPDKN